MLLRTKLAKEVRGGIGAIVAALLTTLFFNEDTGQHMGKSGVWLKLSDGTELQLFLDMGMLLADEAALHAVYNCKGAGGLKPCLLCQNIFSAKSVRDVAGNDRSGWAQPHTVWDSCKLVPHTSATLAALRRRLQTASNTLSKADMDEVETRLGWNWDEHSPLANPEVMAHLDPPSRCTYDWMHVFFVGGIFCVHVGLMMWRLKPFGITYATLQAYMLPWRWPAAAGHRHGNMYACNVA